mgnify:CR=1 FL=1
MSSRGDGVRFEEDLFLGLLPLMMAWISIPLIIIATLLFRPVTTHVIGLLFVPSFAGDKSAVCVFLECCA